MLPKSLHTVRILSAVALTTLAPGVRDPADIRERAVLRAAAVLGYPDASPSDPLIVSAVAAVAKAQAKAAP